MPNSEERPLIRAPVLTMTQQLNELKIRFEFAKTSVPEYHGGSKSLFYFINNTEKFLSNFTLNDPVLNDYFLQFVISRIQGEAKDLVILNNPTNWLALKTLLLNKYKDPRSEQLLLTSLTSCFQTHSQNYEQYSSELNSRLLSLKEHVLLNANNDAEKNAKLTMFDNIAKNTFIAGIKEPYNAYLISQSTTSLDDCINKCRIFDDLKQQTNYHNFLRNSNTKNPFKHTPKPQTNNSHLPIRPNMPQFFPTNQHTFAHKIQHSNTPQRQAHSTQNFPQNKFQIPSQQNVFASNPARPLPRPTPMSTSTRQFPNQQQRPYKIDNFFKSTGPPNPYVKIEEVHQQETVDPTYEYSQPFDENNFSAYEQNESFDENQECFEDCANENFQEKASLNDST